MTARVFVAGLALGLLAACHDHAPVPVDVAAEPDVPDIAEPDVPDDNDTSVVPDEGPEIVEPQCDPGVAKCAFKQLVQCSDEGVEQSFVCDTVCKDSQCDPAKVICTPGEAVCEADVRVATCGADGIGGDVTAWCSYGCDEDKGECLAAACAANASRCSEAGDDTIEVCNDGRTGWEPSGISCSQGCKNGVCSGTCTAGVTRCGASGIEKCDTLGAGFKKAGACDFGCTEASGDATCALCTKNAKSCDGKDVLKCKDIQAGWSVTKTCDETESCAGAQCVDLLVLPADEEERYLALVVAFSDCFAKALPGTCVALDASASGGTSLDEIRTWFCAGAADPAFADSFGDEDAWFTARDVIGACTDTDPSNEVDLFFIDEIQGGKSGVDCVAWSDDDGLANPDGREVMVGPCNSE